MRDDVKSADASTAAAPSIRFKDMSLQQKLAYIGKALLCLCTLGFAFPNIFTE